MKKGLRDTARRGLARPGEAGQGEAGQGQGTLTQRLRTLSLGLRMLDVSVAKVQRSNDDFYQSTQWRAFTRQIVAERGRVCEDCQRSVPVPERIHSDHVDEIHDGGARLDPMNIRLRCTPCHTRKTIATRTVRLSRLGSRTP